ncbi:MAG: hypothetical protein A4E68_01269 [Syntrophaceae bacterium PtaB.Bin095]|nr:MAG: hypothetical protein A4E68_01269 [Syntrophaceae bacterium PtaB.Bin095]
MGTLTTFIALVLVACMFWKSSTAVILRKALGVLLMICAALWLVF